MREMRHKSSKFGEITKKDDQWSSFIRYVVKIYGCIVV